MLLQRCLNAKTFIHCDWYNNPSKIQKSLTIFAKCSIIKGSKYNPRLHNFPEVNCMFKVNSKAADYNLNHVQSKQ